MLTSPLLARRPFSVGSGPVGTLSENDDDDDDDDDDDSENVGKKMNLRSFKLVKLNRVYLDPLNRSNAGDFSWS